MAEWQSQSGKSSETSRTKQVVAYLETEIGTKLLEKAMDNYFAQYPDGEQITLNCLETIGEPKIRKIAEQKEKLKNRAPGSLFGTVKQHVGLWVAIILARKYGPSKVFTYRQKPNGSSSTRQVPDIWKPALDWVNSYTPHKVEWNGNKPTKEIKHDSSEIN